MLYIAAVLLCSLFALGLMPDAVHAQSVAPATVPKFETEPFSGAELLSGKQITQAGCAALPGAVWVAVDRQGECMRDYHSTVGGSGPEALVVFSAEVAATNGRREVRPADYYVKQTPAQMQERSAGWSRSLRMPYLYLGRPGSYGSSGEFAKTSDRERNRSSLRGARLDQIPPWIRALPSRWIQRGRSRRRGAVGATHRSGMRRACIVPSLGAKPARRAGSRPGLHGKQESRRSCCARRSGAEAAGASHHRRNRPGRCRDFGALADRLCEACQRRRFAGAADFRRCPRLACTRGLARWPVIGGGLRPRRQR